MSNPSNRLSQLSTHISPLSRPATDTNMSTGKKEVVETDAIPKPFPVMPFSAAVKHGGLVYLSGNIGMDPKTLKLVEGDIKERTVSLPPLTLLSHKPRMEGWRVN